MLNLCPKGGQDGGRCGIPHASFSFLSNVCAYSGQELEGQRKVTNMVSFDHFAEAKGHISL